MNGTRYQPEIFFCVILTIDGSLQSGCGDFLATFSRQSGYFSAAKVQILSIFFKNFQLFLHVFISLSVTNVQSMKNLSCGAFLATFSRQYGYFSAAKVQILSIFLKNFQLFQLFLHFFISLSVTNAQSLKRLEFVRKIAIVA